MSRIVCATVVALSMWVTESASAQGEVPLPGNIIFSGTEAEKVRARYGVQQLAATRAGARLLSAIGETDKTMHVIRGKDPNGYLLLNELDASFQHPDGTPNRGTDVVVDWNPNYEPDGTPAEIVLGAEMVRALYAMRGESRPGIYEDDPAWTDWGAGWETLSVIGLPRPGFNDREHSENKLRVSWNLTYGTDLPQRTSASPSFWAKHDNDAKGVAQRLNALQARKSAVELAAADPPPTAGLGNPGAFHDHLFRTKGPNAVDVHRMNDGKGGWKLVSTPLDRTPTPDLPEYRAGPGGRPPAAGQPSSR